MNNRVNCVSPVTINLKTTYLIIMPPLNEEHLLQLSSKFPDEIYFPNERLGKIPRHFRYYFNLDLRLLYECDNDPDYNRLLTACETCRDVAKNFPIKDRSEILFQIAEYLRDSGKSWAAVTLYLNAINETENDSLWLSLGKILLENDLIITALLCFIQTDNPEAGI